MQPEHQHEWREVHEQSIIGGTYPIAFECRLCQKWIEKSQIDPIAGIGGRLIKEYVLVGINGGRGNCTDGSVFERQIRHEDGRLEIIR